LSKKKEAKRLLEQLLREQEEILKGEEVCSDDWWEMEQALEEVESGPE
jgi:hypothetical protein